MEHASPPASSSSSPPRKKRRRGEGRSRPLLENEYLLPGPDGGAEEDAGALGSGSGSLDFHELLDEDALRHKFTVVNRAPVMMAWACVVAERLGFSRDEALSIGTYPIHPKRAIYPTPFPSPT